MIIYAVVLTSKKPGQKKKTSKKILYYKNYADVLKKTFFLNKEMKLFHQKFFRFWDYYAPQDSNLNDEQNIKRLFGLRKPSVTPKPDFEKIKPRPIRPFRMLSVEQDEEFKRQREEWEQEEKNFVLDWLTTHGKKYYDDDNEYWHQRQIAVDNLAIEMTGMSFEELNNGDSYKKYRYSLGYSIKEINVLEELE